MRVRVVSAVALGSLVLLATAGCADSDAEAGAPPTSKSLPADVQKVVTRPTTVGITEPLKSPIPAGKTIAWVTCSIPSCQQLDAPMKEAAAAAGWTLKEVNGGATPTTIGAAWDEVVK